MNRNKTVAIIEPLNNDVTNNVSKMVDVVSQ